MSPNCIEIVHYNSGFKLERLRMLNKSLYLILFVVFLAGCSGSSNPSYDGSVADQPILFRAILIVALQASAGYQKGEEQPG